MALLLRVRMMGTFLAIYSYAIAPLLLAIVVIIITISATGHRQL